MIATIFFNYPAKKINLCLSVNNLYITDGKAYWEAELTDQEVLKILKSNVCIQIMQAANRTYRLQVAMSLISSITFRD